MFKQLITALHDGSMIVLVLMFLFQVLAGPPSKISGMAAKFSGLGSTLDDAAMVKKLLDTVPDRLYPAVAGIEQFCDVATMPFEEALGRLKAFDERSRRRA